MSSARSSELRTRFREYIEEGLSVRAAAARFKIICGNGCPLAAQVARDGAIAPEVQGRPPGHGKLSAHRELLEEHVSLIWNVRHASAMLTALVSTAFTAISRL